MGSGLVCPAVVADFQTLDWGLVPYEDALRRQLDLVDARLRGEVPDTLVFVEHPPVYTLGVRRGAEAHLRWDASERARRGIRVVKTSRGGDVTCHAPGQVVGYPVLDLSTRRDLHAYLRDVEAVLIEALSGFGVTCGRRPGLTGLWVGTRKIAAIGVAVRRWVTYHGFAVNANNDLDAFGGIVPCGIAAETGTVTSARQELGEPLDLEAFKESVEAVFWKKFLNAPLRPRPGT